MPRPLLRRFLGDASGEMLKSTARAIAIASIFSAGVAYYVAEKTEKERVALAGLFGLADNQRAGVDPTTTGSITIRSVLLDPCNAPAKR